MVLIALSVWFFSGVELQLPTLGGIWQVYLSDPVFTGSILLLIAELISAYVLCLLLLLLLRWRYHKQPVVRWLSEPFFFVMVFLSIMAGPLMVVLVGLGYVTALLSTLIQVFSLSAAMLVLGGSFQVTARLVLLATWGNVYSMVAVNTPDVRGFVMAMSLFQMDQAVAGLILLIIVAVILDYGTRTLFRRFATV